MWSGWGEVMNGEDEIVEMRVCDMMRWGIIRAGDEMKGWDQKCEIWWGKFTQLDKISGWDVIRYILFYFIILFILKLFTHWQRQLQHLQTTFKEHVSSFLSALLVTFDLDSSQGWFRAVQWTGSSGGHGMPWWPYHITSCLSTRTSAAQRKSNTAWWLPWEPSRYSVSLKYNFDKFSHLYTDISTGPLTILDTVFIVMENLRLKSNTFKNQFYRKQNGHKLSILSTLAVVCPNYEFLTV